ncbi:hypothetical protein EV702DRAFT_1044911 [Suillus placidus]|uniref:Uncharacterized protein n=1 Tax=Suillus placidus TaxID=48579 RepID=A0A9P6ZWB3_9AGAM|nr:hypothetical protein EV702DRAFT_1044911 [Suillus placidus]
MMLHWSSFRSPTLESLTPAWGTRVLAIVGEFIAKPAPVAYTVDDFFAGIFVAGLEEMLKGATLWMMGGGGGEDAQNWVTDIGHAMCNLHQLIQLQHGLLRTVNNTLDAKIASSTEEFEELQTKTGAIDAAVKDLEKKILEIGGSRVLQQKSIVDAVREHEEKSAETRSPKLNTQNSKLQLTGNKTPIFFVHPGVREVMDITLQAEITNRDNSNMPDAQSELIEEQESWMREWNPLMQAVLQPELQNMKCQDYQDWPPTASLNSALGLRALPTGPPEEMMTSLRLSPITFSGCDVPSESGDDACEGCNDTGIHVYGTCNHLTSPMDIVLEWEVNEPLLEAPEGPKMIRTGVQSKLPKRQGAVSTALWDMGNVW